MRPTSKGVFMRLQINIPLDVAGQLRNIADAQHRDIRRQVEKFVIDSVREYSDVETPEPSSEEEHVNAR
jgi:hypothetical protein